MITFMGVVLTVKRVLGCYQFREDLEMNSFRTSWGRPSPKTMFGVGSGCYNFSEELEMTSFRTLWGSPNSKTMFGLDWDVIISEVILR